MNFTLKPLAAALTLSLAAATATAAVWAPQSSGGSSGGSCHIVVFNTASYGSGKMLMGNGVTSGGTYFGFLRGSPNPQSSGTTNHFACAASGDCAWNLVINGNGNYVVSVSGLPITSATPVACF